MQGKVAGAGAGKSVDGEDFDVLGVLGGFTGALAFVLTMPSISPSR